MVTMAQRIEQLRTERNLSRPALAASLGFPRMAMEKFETGRQTPSQEQQGKLAAYFGVSLPYLRGEAADRTSMGEWMEGAFMDEPAPAPAPIPRRQAAQAAPADFGEGQGSMLDSLLAGKKFQETLRSAVLEALRSPEGQELLAKAIHRELKK